MRSAQDHQQTVVNSSDLATASSGVAGFSLVDPSISAAPGARGRKASKQPSNVIDTAGRHSISHIEGLPTHELAGALREHDAETPSRRASKAITKRSDGVSEQSALQMEALFAHELAESLSNYYLYYGDSELINTELSRYQNVKRDDIQRVAKKYLTKNNRVVLHYLPKSESTNN